MYDQYINIDKKFKSSVNLQYDLGNEEKILLYVPTTDLCDVIKGYVKSVLFENECKATLLAGPYGKGKSYIMLMITYLFSKRENRELFDAILQKIGIVDPELVDLIREVDKRKIHLLPVIINNNDSDDLNQNFMLAIRAALKSIGAEDIVPASVYSECLKQIDIWENSGDLNLIGVCEEKFKISLFGLKAGLKDFDKKAYENFLKIFECINHGYKFNALVGNDFASIYFAVANSVSQYGYTGLFVIFDEFGVFLENKTPDFAIRLNKIQSFAERCNSSPENAQIYLCCITHKEISLYQGDKTYFDDFEKISGRFKEVRFDRSLDENYQIICNAIEKTDDYKTVAEKFFQEHSALYDAIESSGILGSEEQFNYVKQHGFPINPIALFALIHVSEKIAQNERTLFTFISDSDLYSFRYFITNNASGLLNVDYIYNYFQGLIRANNDYKSLFYKVDSLSKIDLKKEHHDIFKCIALMKIINDDIKYSSSIANIAISLGKDELEIKEAIDELISANILKKSVANSTIDFDVLADNEINKLIDSIVTSKISYKTESELLSEFDTDRYVVSNKYNFEFSMTRYFFTCYLSSSELKKLRSFGLLLRESKSDGIIINLINDDNMSIGEIIDLLNRDESLDVYRVIIRINSNRISEDVFIKLRRICAAQILMGSKNGLNDADNETLKVSIEDMTSELRDYLKEYHLHSICLNKSDYSIRTLTGTTYASLVKSFPKTIVFNNEQVNRHIISSVTAKARNNVIDNIIGNTDVVYGPTSAEGTITESFTTALFNAEEIITHIQSLIMDCEGRVCAQDLVSYLSEFPFGMRRGIIPFFVAKAISMMTIFENNNVQTVLMYNDTMQIKLDAVNLSKMMVNPTRYFFSFKKVNKDRLHFVESLANIFNLKVSHNFNEDAEVVVKGLRSYVSNLEPVIVKSSVSDNILGLSDNELKFKDLFLRRDLSTFDILCEEMNCFGTNSAEILGNVLLIKNSYKEKVARLFELTIQTVKKYLGNLSEESIKTNYEKWKNDNPNIVNIIFNDDDKKIFTAFETAQYSDCEVIDKLSFAILNCTLNDWNCKRQDEFFAALDRFIKFITSNVDSTTLTKQDLGISLETDALSKLGTTLYTNLQEIIEEYGFSISNAEKANILKKLLKDLID